MNSTQPNSFDQAVVASYLSHTDAEAAVRLLAKDGLPMDRISIIGRNFKTRGNALGFYRPADAATDGAAAGAWFDGLFDLLLGTGLFILTVAGPVFVLGPLAGLVADGISGVGTGALISGLNAAGISRDHALKCQAHIQAGEFLVVVHGGADRTSRAPEILEGTTQAHLLAHGTPTRDGKGPDLLRTRM